MAKKLSVVPRLPLAGAGAGGAGDHRAQGQGRLHGGWRHDQAAFQNEVNY